MGRNSGWPRSQARQEAIKEMMAACDCVYPAGGELCLTMCVAVSSVLNRYGAALPANDLTAYLEQVSSTIETQLQLTRTGHQAGAEVQPFVDQLSAALESVSNLAPNELGQQVAVSLAR